MRKLSLVLLVVAFACNSNSKKENYKKLIIPVWGTKCEIIYKEKKGVEVEEYISEFFKELSDQISTYDSTSHLSVANRNESKYVSPYMLALLDLSKEMYDLTDGAFDPTVQPLVKEWGFLKQEGKWMDTTRLPAILEYVGLEKWKWNDSLIVEKPTKAAIDFNAIAPGYATDLIAFYFQCQGIHDFFINNGGEIALAGNRPNGGPWQIGVTSPETQSKEKGDTLYKLTEICLATSGNYINQFEYEGSKYGHTISSKTGMPIQTNLLSATVIASSAAKADAFATACMALNKDSAVQLMKRNKLKGYLIYASKQGDVKREMVN